MVRPGTSRPQRINVVPGRFMPPPRAARACAVDLDTPAAWGSLTNVRYGGKSGHDANRRYENSLISSARHYIEPLYRATSGHRISYLGAELSRQPRGSNEEFEALAWDAANLKARQLGWIL
jgi:hypothetical protein